MVFSKIFYFSSFLLKYAGGFFILSGFGCCAAECISALSFFCYFGTAAVMCNHGNKAERNWLASQKLK